MKTLDKILAILVLVLFSFCIFLVVQNNKIKQENVTLQAAINKPAVEQKPKVIYKETIRLVPKEIIKDLSEGEREVWAKQIEDLENQVFAFRTTEVSIDGGSVTKPEVPVLKPQDPNAPKDKRCVVTGMGYTGAAEIAVGYQPIRKLDLYGLLGYHSQSKVGAGLLYRF